ncbi:MAG: M24 family metallopeptidase [Filifactoraceae bacterium]
MKIEKLRNLMSEKNVESAFILMPENRRYFSEFTGTTGSVFITFDKAYFITDFRYIDQANVQCKGFEIIDSSDIKEYELIIRSGVKSVFFEDSYMDVSSYEKLKNNIGDVLLVPFGDSMHVIRGIKSESEIENLKKAAKIGDEAFEHMLKYIKVGMSEKEVALELEFTMRKLGATGCSFESIVASGIRSSLPHGVASEKIIENGDFLTLDYGCMYNGYCSDMTRTVVVGKASNDQKELYNLVLKAQEAAFDGIKPGNTCKRADDIARGIISDAGYGENFGHGLGHGVGLEIHEYPNLSPRGGDIILEKNMIVTNEPGIYISGKYGVRIEDLVLVTEDGYEILSHSTKKLLEI